MSGAISSSGKRLFLGHFIEDVSLGQSFLRSRWPLHITVVPWFLCEDTDALDAALIQVVSPTRPFSVRVGDEEMFGSKKNIKVNVIDPDPQLSKLHDQLLSVINNLGRLDSDQQFVGESYRAHITHSGERHIAKGRDIMIDSIHLTELTDEGRCTPLRRYNMDI
jgi:2'-5' RNA ligase